MTLLRFTCNINYTEYLKFEFQRPFVFFVCFVFKALSVNYYDGSHPGTLAVVVLSVCSPLAYVQKKSHSGLDFYLSHKLKIYLLKIIGNSRRSPTF